jgi:protein-tyrosine-phosphatase/predicted ATP-grasp superfamily ATP-dependent carboligase
MELPKVLVLGDDSRAFLAVVRSLGRHGLAVHVVPFDHGAAALRSRHVAAVHRLPPYNLAPESWVAALGALLAEHRFALVVPTDDRTILPLHRHRASWGATRIALPNERAFAAFFDKLATRELALAAGVPVCQGEALGPSPDAGALVARYGLPLALKPRHSFDLDQLSSRRSVVILRSEAALRDAMAALRSPTEYLVESFFEGEGVGVSILAAEGKVLQAFQHHRVFESGPTGGSTYRVSAPLDPTLAEATAALARAAALHGVAMCEYRRNMGSGEAVLLEVNARFWGSLPLAIAAGIDFPAQLYDLLAQDRRHPRVEYRVRHYARSLGNDAYRLVRDLGDRSVPLPKRLWRASGEVAVGLGRALSGRETHDTFAPDDLRPWLREWGEIGSWIAGGVTRRLPWLARAAAARRRRAFLERLRPDPGGARRRLLILCFGNICRSPLAAALLARELGVVRPDIDVAQAGFVAREGRASPPHAIAEAGRMGIDLAAHASRYAHDEEVAAADAILVFDSLNIAELARRGLPVAGRVAMLGDFARRPDEVDDPYGHSAEVFHGTYARIADYARALVAAMKR